MMLKKKQKPLPEPGRNSALKNYVISKAGLELRGAQPLLLNSSSPREEIKEMGRWNFINIAKKIFHCVIPYQSHVWLINNKFFGVADARGI